MGETELTVTAADGLAIAGTLTVPTGEGPHPAVALLCPGQLDREGDVPKARLSFGRPLATALAARGVASYRFDRRGVGATPGDWRATGFYQHREDAAAVVRALAARPEIGTVGVVGYSEGALHAAWLAAQEVAAAAVLIACPTRNGREALDWWAAQLRTDEIPWPVRLLLRVLRRTPQEQVDRMCAKLLATTGDTPRVYGIKMPGAYREYLAHDPQPDLAAIQVPVLALHGSKDRNVDPGGLDVIAQLVPGPVETRLVPDLTHLLRRDPGPASIRAYREQYGRPVDAGLLEEIVTWVSTVVRSARA